MIGFRVRYRACIGFRVRGLEFRDTVRIRA